MKDHLAAVVQEVVAGATISEQKEANERCNRLVVVGTLLRRSGELNDGVDRFNQKLREIHAQRLLRRGTPCAAASDQEEGNVLLCHPCLRIVDLQRHVEAQTGGGHRFLSQYTFDGLHPNDAGDDVVGREFAKLVMHV